MTPCPNKWCFFHVAEDSVDRWFFPTACENTREDYPELCEIRREYEDKVGVNIDG